MLQKISGKNRRLEAIEVCTPEELKRCDALVIPGGGLPISLPLPPFFFTAESVCADFPRSRVDHHHAARASERVDGTPQRVCQDEAGVGDLRRCNSPCAGRVQSEEGRTGTAQWHLGQDYEERLGITSVSSHKRR